MEAEVEPYYYYCYYYYCCCCCTRTSTTPIATDAELGTKDLDTRHNNVDKEERRHSPQHALRNRSNDGGNLGNAAKKDEEKAAAVACAPAEGKGGG